MKYPFHRIGSLLTAEEAQSSSIVRDTLASKAEGNGQTSRLELVQAEARLEETSKVTETPKVWWKERGKERVGEGGKKREREGRRVVEKKEKNKEREVRQVGRGGGMKGARQGEIPIIIHVIQHTYKCTLGGGFCYFNGSRGERRSTATSQEG